MMETIQADETISIPAPLITVPEVPGYPLFTPVDAPQGSEAIRAWRGTVQPFLDDVAARRFLRCVEAGRPFDIVEGTVIADDPLESKHWADRWLVKTHLRFVLLILEFHDPEHPRAYSLSPEISRQMHPLHPHLRTDKSLFINWRPISALCVYSGAEFTYSTIWPRLMQFLDQTSTFIARHIIWLKTRIQLPSSFGEAFKIPEPGELIFDQLPLVQTDSNFSSARRLAPLWHGYWPGAAAPSGLENHLSSISRSQECWCCSGRKYGECHRPIELQRLRMQDRQ